MYMLLQRTDGLAENTFEFYKTQVRIRVVTNHISIRADFSAKRTPWKLSPISLIQCSNECISGRYHCYKIKAIQSLIQRKRMNFLSKINKNYEAIIQHSTMWRMGFIWYTRTYWDCSLHYLIENSLFFVS